LTRLELQYALAQLKLEKKVSKPPLKAQRKAVDLERGTVKLSSHMAGALKLYRSGDNLGCASELYAADALLSKIVPKLKKEGKK
jgi:hypothetical protein